jgi:nucleoside-diphosphate-sugar epimerase
MRCMLGAADDLRLASARRKAERGSAVRILIAGASGAIGRPLVRRLRANQHEVFALTRSPDSAPALKEISAEPVITDALDAAAVKAAVGRTQPDAVINELTSLPRHYTPTEKMKAAAERDRKIRHEGNINLLAALRDAGVRRYRAKFRFLV